MLPLKKIESNQKSSYKIAIFLGIAFLFFSFPIFIPSVLDKIGVEGAEFLLLLMFPIFGIGALFWGWNMRKRFLYFGLTPLVPSPEIGQVGGQVGGRIELNQYFEKYALSATLDCINVYKTWGSIDNNSREHHDVIWRDQMTPLYRKKNSGSLIEFCFDVPAGEYTESTYKGRGSVYWEVCVEGLMNGVKFNRSWSIPVEEGTQSSSIIITDRHKETSADLMKEKAEESVAQQINTKTTFNGLDIVSKSGINKTFSFLFLLMGTIVSFIGFVVFDKHQLMLLLIGTLFSLSGYMLLGYGVLLIGRKLECTIRGTTVSTRRRFFGLAVKKKQGKLISTEQLSLQVTMSSTINGTLTEVMAIYAIIDDPVSKSLKLVEGIKGRQAGEAMMKKISTTVLENSRFY